MGAALQGTLEEVRMLSWDQTNQKYRFDKIGAGESAQLDNQLKILLQSTEHADRNMWKVMTK